MVLTVQASALALLHSGRRTQTTCPKPVSAGEFMYGYPSISDFRVIYHYKKAKRQLADGYVEVVN
jgi:hypothetical protein